MISYNTREWLGIFALHKAETIRRLLPLILFICVYTMGIVFVQIHWLKLASGSALSNITVMHSLLGFALSMLLVFRTNTAYDRWWEGRKLWGALVNNSRNLAVKLHTLLPDADAKDRIFFRKAIPVFASYLAIHLQSDITRLELDNHPHPEIPGFDRNKHMPSLIVALCWERLYRLHTEKKISAEQLIILNVEMQSFLEVCGACERIKNTPIPYSYSAFIKKFIFFFVITLPFSYAFSLGYLAIPVVAFIFYVLGSLELIAEEIEDPFGSDANDLPLKELSRKIKMNVEEIFD